MTDDTPQPAADGARKPDAVSPPEPVRRGPEGGGRRRDGWRAALVWALGLVAIVGLSLLAAWAGVVLAAFGLGALVLVIGATAVLTSALWARRLLLPAATVALAFMLSATAVQLVETRLDPSFGALIAAPTEPGEVREDGYTRGFGPVLVDLRQFRAAPGSTTRIAARSDDDRVVVALPRDRCFDLDVRYSVGDEFYSETRMITRRAAALLGATAPDDGWMAFSASGISERERQILREIEADARNPKLPAQNRQTAPRNLLLFGLNPHTPGRAVRRSAEPRAPKLVLDLRAGQQIVVRDYPGWAGPLATGEDGMVDQVSGTTWPAGVRAPLSPGERGWRTRAAVHTRVNRARWVKWEQEIVPWAQAQAKRMAGACATRAELARRAYRFYIQPERFRDDGGRVRRLVGGPTTRRSAIEQPVALTPRVVFAVDVDGLGRARVVDQLPPSAIWADPIFEPRTR